MKTNNYLSFSNHIKYSTLIGIGAASSTFLGICINNHKLPGYDWRDIAFYGFLGVLITSKYLLTN